MGAIQHKNTVAIALLLGLGLLALSLLPLSALAQSGCTGDPCVFYTPTATGTPTPLPTAGAGTPTPVPWPSAIPFPNPDYIAPTSIPSFAFPSVPSPLDIDMPDMLPYFAGGLVLTAPNPITLSAINLPITGSEEIELSEISTTLTLSYSQLLTLNMTGSGSSTITPTNPESITAVYGVIGDASGFVGEMVSYTTWLSGELAFLEPTETFTIASAPAWYAPDLPRPMADVGYTIEGLETDVNAGTRYSMSTWAWLAGYIVSMPLQFIKVLYQLVQFLGPLGLFITWLLLMLPFVLTIKGLVLIKNLIITFLNFVISIIGFLFEIISFVIKLFL